MRVISWNMGCSYGSRYKVSQPRTWQQLLTWSPDVALVQETTEPKDLLAPDTYLFKPYGWSARAGKEIGTLVYAAAGGLAEQGPLEWEEILPGQVTVATLPMAESAQSLLLASVHADTKPLDPVLLGGAGGGIGATHTTKIYPVDLIRHELSGLTSGLRFIVGGDFNLSIRFDDLYTRSSDLYGNVEWFSRVRGAGWWNAHRKFHVGDQRTLFRPGKPDEHFQIDHIFTDRTTWSQVSACDVLQVPYLEELTDHAPVAMEISDRMSKRG